MERIYTTLQLDFNNNKSLQTVDVAQGDDKGRVIELRLYDNGERTTLLGTDTATLDASINGVIIAEGVSCNVDAQNNVIYVIITDDITAIPGIAHCMVKIKNASNDILHTARFDLNIEPNPAEDGITGVLPASSIVSRLETIENSYVASTTVRQIVTITESAYDALATKDSSTMYCILPDPET